VIKWQIKDKSVEFYKELSIMAFQPGVSGNPAGKPVGAKDRRTSLRKLFEDRAEELINKAIEMALGGDTVALKLCLERCVSRKKDEPVEFHLPRDITNGDSLILIGANILRTMEKGKITPEQAKTLLEVMGLYRDNFVVQELCQNLNTLAARFDNPQAKELP
jgi:hypothetical protein